MEATTNRIRTVSADDHRRGMLTFHAPGCAHLRSLEVLAEVDYPVADLRAWEAESKSLGCPNPVAPCLRKLI